MRLKIFYFVILPCSILFCMSCAFLQSGTYEEKLDYYFNYYSERKLFCGSVLAAKDGNIILNKGYGIAKAVDDSPFMEDTKTSIMSISKQITAASILLLEERGALSTNDLASKYISELKDNDSLLFPCENCGDCIGKRF